MNIERRCAHASSGVFADRKLLTDPDCRYAIEGTLAALDRGELRVATPPDVEGGEWTTHAWVKEAILLYFALRKMRDDRGRAVRVPRQDPPQDGLRPRACASSRPAVARYGAFLEPGVHPDARLRQHRRARRRRHDGRHVGHGRLVRADRARLPPRRRRRHRRRARAAERAARHRRGRRLRRLARRSSSRACASAARPSSAPASCSPPRPPILDVSGPQVVEHRGRVPPRSVVIPGTRAKTFPAGEFGVPCALIIGAAHARAPTARSASTRRCATSGCRCDGAREASTRLDETLLWLCAIASPIGEERALCDAVQARLGSSLPPRPPLRRLDRRAGHAAALAGPQIALVGHLDTVRTENGPARIEGDRCFGAGASDMKSGLAVMIALAETLDRATLAVRPDAGLLRARGGALRRERARARARARTPSSATSTSPCAWSPRTTSCTSGCIGSIHATVTFEGRTAHSARPWEGDNAITKAAGFLAELGALRAARERHRRPRVPHGDHGDAGARRRARPQRRARPLRAQRQPPLRPRQHARATRRLAVAPWSGTAPSVEFTDLSPAAAPRAGHPLVRGARRRRASAASSRSRRGPTWRASPPSASPRSTSDRARTRRRTRRTSRRRSRSCTRDTGSSRGG